MTLNPGQTNSNSLSYTMLHTQPGFPNPHLALSVSWPERGNWHIALTPVPSHLLPSLQRKQTRAMHEEYSQLLEPACLTTTTTIYGVTDEECLRGMGNEFYK